MIGRVDEQQIPGVCHFPLIAPTVPEETRAHPPAGTCKYETGTGSGKPPEVNQMKPLLIALVVAVVCLAGCMTTAPPSVEGYTDVTATEANYLIDTTAGLVIIDVSPIYDQGHIPGAVNYYVGDGSLDAAIPALDPTAPYLVYCHTDAASILGAQKLVDTGFTTVYRLDGNFAAWVDAGYPVET